MFALHPKSNQEIKKVCSKKIPSLCKFDLVIGFNEYSVALICLIALHLEVGYNIGFQQHNN